MSDKRNDGNPAFPFKAELPYHPGMSLRDWFAGMALQGLYAGDKHRANDDAPAIWAKEAYSIADAMLAEREK